MVVTMRKEYKVTYLEDRRNHLYNDLHKVQIFQGCCRYQSRGSHIPDVAC